MPRKKGGKDSKKRSTKDDTTNNTNTATNNTNNNNNNKKQKLESKVKGLDQQVFDASEVGDLETVKSLVEKGAYVNGQFGWGSWTPIEIATTGGHLEVVKFLVKHGAKYLPLNIACRTGRLDIVKYFVEEAGADINGLDRPDNETPVHSALKHMDILKYILDKGPNLSAIDLDGYSVLHSAALHGEEPVKLLLEHGADVDPLRAFGDAQLTPLCCAIVKSYPGVVKILLEHGADVNRRNDYNNWMTDNNGDFVQKQISETPLHRAISFASPNEPDTILIIWHLVLAGASLDALYHRGSETKTVWQMSCSDETRQALLHFWTPKTHKYHPSCVKQAIFSILLIAKRQKWIFDSNIMHRILAFVAFDWFDSNTQVK